MCSRPCPPAAGAPSPASARAASPPRTAEGARRTHSGARTASTGRVGDARFRDEALRANRTIADRVREIAERIGATPAQVALTWITARGEHVVPIPGTKTPRYLLDNVGAGDLQLSEQDLDALPAPVGDRY